MRSTLKYITVIFLTVSLLVSAAGCGNEAAGSGDGAEAQKDYVSEYIDLGEGIDDAAFFNGMQQFGDELCCLADDNDGGQVLEKYSLTDGSRTSISFTWLEPADGHYIVGFAFAEDGGIVASVYQYTEPDSTGKSSFTKQLCGFDARGDQTFAVDISKQLKEESGNGANRILAVDLQGHIYISGKTKVWLYDLQGGAEPDYRGEVSVCSGEESRISSLICDRDGRVYACCRVGENISFDAYSLAQIDFDEGRIGAVYEDFPGAGGIARGLEKDFLVYDDSAVYEYDLASGAMELVLKWVENNVAGSEVQYFGTLTDGRIYAVTRDWSRDDAGIVIFSKATGEDWK